VRRRKLVDAEREHISAVNTCTSIFV